MDYSEALAYIASLAPRGWRLGLDRMQEFATRAGLVNALGDPEGPQYIHVAGTNGKGSTTAYLQSILHESGYRVGSFFSPYVYDPRERIQLGRELIPKKIFAGLTAMLMPVSEEFTETEFGGISEFEFKTAMAFLFFQRLKCEWVALEVGLGGRLDATNIVVPRCSIITSIGLDHVGILGDTLEAIAGEKAGIIKHGIPVVVGQLPPAAMEVVVARASETSSTLWQLGRDVLLSENSGGWSVTTPIARHEKLLPGILGEAQPQNMALAVAAIDAVGATRTISGFVEGVASAYAPGRFEERLVDGKRVVLDGAHNSDAAANLVQTFIRSFPATKARVVVGMVEGHDMHSMLQPLKAIASAAYAVPIDFHRTRMPEELAHELRCTDIPALEFESAIAGFRAALADLEEEEILLVTGSFYLVGEVGRSLTA